MDRKGNIMKKLLLILFGITFLLMGCNEGNLEAEESALEESDRWVKVLDKGDYDYSWDQASEVLQSKNTRRRWNKKLRGMRDNRGDLISRSFKSTKFRKSYPSFGVGTYVRVQYMTEFEHSNGPLIETVLMIQDEDTKVWNAVNYWLD